ncbi:MAG: vitamin K epoxide reductase [Anaerolineae bacterium]|nr:vitamin K epoxide reductase [Anaerolineae bacterium]
MKFRIRLLFVLLGLLLGTPPLPTLAQDIDSPTGMPTGQVRVVYFTSPLCSFCQQVEERDLPPLEARYGDSLYILRVDTTTSLGQRLFQTAWEQYAVPLERRGTPAMIINETVLVGAVEIPTQLPGLIADLLAVGGNDWPTIPGLEEAITLDAEIEEADGRPLWRVRFLRDLPANAISAALLVLMIVLALALARPALWRSQFLTRVPLWVKLGIALIGLGVALYLLNVEVTETEVFCGPIGECNVVQGSRYAILLGFLPMALLGVIGYAAILATYVYEQWLRGPYAGAMLLVRFLLAAFGFLFSIWLTYLQPFVIGATCIWCLISAVTMTLTALLNAESGWGALQTLQKRGWKGYLRMLQRETRRTAVAVAAAPVERLSATSSRRSDARKRSGRRRR